MAGRFNTPGYLLLDDQAEHITKPIQYLQQPAIEAIHLQGKNQDQISTNSKEPPKVVVDRGHGLSALVPLLHTVPAFISGGILALTFANIYWSDLGSPNQNSVLNILQFAAKFHEILITASLSAILLHRIRYELIKESGVALGYLTSGYQLTSLGYLFTREFLGALTTHRRRPARSWLPLYILVPLMFLLAAVVGPASAIMLIPKPNWWGTKNPLNGTMISTFQPLRSTEIWPTHISAKLLVQPNVVQESGNCTSDVAYKDENCPSGGWDQISTWAGNYMNQLTEPNITASDATGATVRYITSSRIEKDVGWAISSTIGARQTRDLGTLWQFLNTKTDLEVAKFGRPKLIPSLAHLPTLKKPLIEAQCEQYERGDPNIVFRTDRLKLGDVGDMTWNIPQSIDIPEVARDNKPVSFQWVDMTQYTDLPLLGAILISTTVDNKTGIWPCIIAPYWTPVNVWYDPTEGPSVVQDTPDPMRIVTQLVNGTLPKDQHPQALPIDLAWAETLNAPYDLGINSPNNLTLLEDSASRFGYYPGDGIFKLMPAGGQTDMPWLFSTLLSMHVADGLARVNFGYSTVIYEEYHPNTHNHSGSLHDLDDINTGGWSGQPLDTANYAQIARTSNATSNTEILWRIERYGYGWGFANGVVVLLGAAILLVHAAIAFAHVGVVMFGSWGVSSAWTSMGEMVALAVGSRVPADGSMDNTSAGISHRETWGEVVRVRGREMGAAEGQRRRRLELVFGEGLDGDEEAGGEEHVDGVKVGLVEKAVIGKKYN